MVLYGLDVMPSIPKKTMTQIVDLNNRALKAIMGVGKHGCPLSSLYLELACWTVQNQILYKSLLFVHHVATLPEESLARDFFELQSSQNIKDSVVVSCLDILKSWNITNLQSYTKPQFKRFIKKKISIKNSEELFSWAENYKKIQLSNYEKDLKMQNYVKKLNLAKARLIFRKNCGFLKTFRMNFKNEKKVQKFGI